MRLSDHLDHGRVQVPLQGATKEALLEELVQLALPDQPRREEVLAALFRREAIQSTGIGHAVAIPHCIAPIGTDAALAAGTHPVGVDFGAADDTPARIFFMVLSAPGKRSRHLRLLSAVSTLLGQEACRRRLLECRDGEAFLRVIHEAEGPG